MPAVAAVVVVVVLQLVVEWTIDLFDCLLLEPLPAVAVVVVVDKQQMDYHSLLVVVVVVVDIHIDYPYVSWQQKVVSIHIHHQGVLLLLVLHPLPILVQMEFVVGSVVVVAAYHMDW